MSAPPGPKSAPPAPKSASPAPERPHGRVPSPVGGTARSAPHEVAATICPARWPDDLPVVRGLFVEYAQGLGFDLGFQDFEAELAALPGKYEPPAGRVLIAWRDGRALGCVALRPVREGTCEMKRLYVRVQARGMRLGRRLAERVCDEARVAGYRRICLDTLSTMEAARRLYVSLGFEPVEPYVFNPIPGAMFLGRRL